MIDFGTCLHICLQDFVQASLQFFTCFFIPSPSNIGYRYVLRPRTWIFIEDWDGILTSHNFWQGTRHCPPSPVPCLFSSAWVKKYFLHRWCHIIIITNDIICILTSSIIASLSIPNIDSEDLGVGGFTPHSPVFPSYQKLIFDLTFSLPS